MSSNPLPKERQFLPIDFKITNWEFLKKFYELLLAKETNSVEELRIWLSYRNELEGVISEESAWRYIHTTWDTGNEVYRKKYEEYVTEILPHIMSLSHQLDKKIIQCPHKVGLAKESGYDLLIYCLDSHVKIYREENIPLLTQIQLEAQNYSKIISEMTITRAGKEITLQQATAYLELPDRKLREEVYDQISIRRLQDTARLDELYSSLVQKRHTVACNAGFTNFEEYTFVSLKRFDYTPKDCADFHQSIQKIVVPFLKEIVNERKKILNVTSLRPWDHAVDPAGRAPLKPFNSTPELLQKTTLVLDKLHPFLGDCLHTMQRMGRFDLESRKGKAPGGYNFPLKESGVPFIFMNTAQNFQDVITLLHESGHAVHSFLMHDLPLHDFKDTTSEMAELASMSMELLTIDYWDIFFDTQEDVRRAQKEHLENIITRLAWIAIIDKFQSWVYNNPHHTTTARQIAWKEIFDIFSDEVTSWDGYEESKHFLWQKQLHLFEVPLYYIEYGIAQLGAIAIWKNYKQNSTKTLKDYLNALKLGYTKPLPYMYKTAGIRLDWSMPYIQSLIDFLREEWKSL